MKTKFYFLISFFIFISTQANSLPRCENLYNAIYNENIKYDVGIRSFDAKKTIGIRLDNYWNTDREITLENGEKTKKPGWDLVKNKDNYFIVGKITKTSLLNQVEIGDIILSINNIDLRELAKNKEKKITLEKDISDLFNENESIKFKILKKNNVVSEVISINTIESFNQPAVDFYINAIDIKEKEGYVNASIQTSFYEDLDKRHFLTEAIWEHIVADKKFEDGSLQYFYWEQCSYSDERWSKLNTVNPAYGLKFANLIKEDKTTRTSEYNLKPSISYSNELKGYAQDQAEITYDSNSTYAIKNEFNLKSFPFDKQKIKFFLYNDKFGLEDYRSLITSWTVRRALEFADINNKNQNNIEGWNIVGVKTAYEIFNDPNEGPRDGVSVTFNVERKSGYYLFKIILPIILILTVCWSAVWIDPKEIESRLTITIVCLLSLIAYNFVIDSELPKLDYLTVMDYIILVSYVYSTIPNFLSIMSFQMIKTNKPLAEKFETYEKKYGLLSYLLLILLIIIFNTSSNPENTKAAFLLFNK
jgi:hypothetical protein|tara:strand:+ start:804 stop:2399 length:1596 start_codon:yes stop_codon:yes gene_type:complete